LQNGARALSHSYVVADFAGRCAVISRYRLEAYATLEELKNSRTQEFKNSRIGIAQWPWASWLLEFLPWLPLTGTV
jgi:hypothetical protein